MPSGGCEPLEVTFDKEATLKDFLEHIIQDETTFKFYTNPAFTWPEDEEDDHGK
jgi:hypothetical protein